jgi:hypothetical protein
MGCTQRFGYAPEYKSAASSGSEGREIVLGCSLLMPPQNLVALSVHDGAPQHRPDIVSRQSRSNP